MVDNGGIWDEQSFRDFEINRDKGTIKQLETELAEARAEIEQLRARNAILDNAIAEMIEEQVSLCVEEQSITELVAAKDKLIEQMREALRLALPEVTFDHALELLAQVEASDPTFDIKLRDEVLCRHAPVYEWNFKIFTRVTEDYFSTTGHVYEQLIPFKGNEHLHGTTATPDGWWEVESGQPVWRRK